jgi:hypothetical protein
MGKIRVAKDGHLYEYRRTYGGRYYTVQHTEGDGTCLIIGLFFGPWTLFVALFVAGAIGWPLTLLLWAAALTAALSARSTPN